MSRKKRNKHKRSRNKNPKKRTSLEKTSKKVDDLFKTALQHHQAMQLQEAETLYRQILLINPDHFDALHNLGVLAYETKRYEISISLINKAITINPNVPNCYCNLGILHNDLGKPEEAISYCKKAIELNPDFAEAHNALGDVLNKTGKAEEAIGYFKQAIKLKPGYAEAYNNIGILLNSLGKPEEAISYCRKAIKVKPDYAEAFANLAYFFESTNRLNDALEAAEQAMQYKQNLPIANLVTAKLERRKGNLQAGLDLIEKINVESSHFSYKAIILNEKGILYDRLGSYDKAFNCFSVSNALISQESLNGQIYKSSYITEISQLESFFLNLHKKSCDRPVYQNKGPNPIFLVGFPRSGTTLLKQILTVRENVQVIEEKPLVNAMIERLAAYDLRYPDDLCQIDFDVIEDLKKVYFIKMSEYINCRHDTIIIDKFPLNIIHIGLIHRVFPKSKIIVALRHPADVCLSSFIQNFKLNVAMVHFFTIEDAANLYNLVMGLWSTYVNLFPLNIHVVKYEDIVSDFNRETRKLFEFIEIPWDPSVRKYNQHAKSLQRIRTPSYHQVSEPIYTRSLYRWKNYASYLKPVLESLKGFVEKFGYDL